MIEIQEVVGEHGGGNCLRYRYRDPKTGEWSPWQFVRTVSIRNLPPEEHPNYRAAR